jgi:hypothetical protein
MIDSTGINPPRHGEGDHAVVAGHCALHHFRVVPLYPCTMLRMVPLPVPGRIFA